MFRIFRTSSKKGDKKKKGNKSNSNDHLNRGVNSKPDGKSVENTDVEFKPIPRKDSIPIGINWITEPSRHSILQTQVNSTNPDNDGIQLNFSAPSRVSHFTENSDMNIKERDSISSKFSNTTSEAENLLSNNKSNRNSINCENSTKDKVNEENVCKNIKVQPPLQGEVITNTNTNIIKQEDTESSSKSTIHHQINNKNEKTDNNTHENKGFQDILELLLTKFNKFEENIMMEINCIKESQEKQENRLQEIQNRQEEVKNTLTQIMSKQLSSSTDKQIRIDDKENLSESENEYPVSIPCENTNIPSSNNLPTIQEADINVDQDKIDLSETDPQSPSISSSLMNSTVTSSVTTSHTLEQSQSQQASTNSAESISDLTDENISTCETLSKSLPTQSTATPLTPCTSLPEAQQMAPSTMAVHKSVSQLEHFNSPITSRNNSPAVPSPFRSTNPPIKHSPPTKPKRLSLQIPMSSSPSQESEDAISCPLRRSIEWPEHSPFAVHKTKVSSSSLKKVRDRDMRMFITITP